MTPPVSQLLATSTGSGIIGLISNMATMPGTEGTSVTQSSQFTAPSFLTLARSANLAGSTAQTFTAPSSLNPIPTTSTQGLPSSVNLPGINTPSSLCRGHTPIPPKLLGEIVAGKYIELADLLPENLNNPTLSPTTFVIAGNQFTPSTIPTKKKQK